MKTIKLTQGKVALVDDADFEAVSKFKWFAYRVGRRFYPARNVRKPDGKRTTQFLHRFLLPNAIEIGHIDGNGCNVQRNNVRSMTHQQNMQGFQHKRLGATSKFRGVVWCKRESKWISRIQVDGKRVFLGSFAVEKEAALAYDAAARKHFKFPHLNFP